MDVTEFLLARIDEDEATAQAAIAWQDGDARPWVDNGGGLATADGHGMAGYVGADVAPHIVRWSPTYVLAECGIKRVIASLHSRDWRGRCVSCAHEGEDYGYEGERLTTCDSEPYPCLTLRALALPYALHPDYQSGWAPEVLQT